MLRERRHPRAGALVILAFLLAGLAVLNDFGWTWDEDESYDAGRQNLRLIRAVFTGEPAQWPWHELTGYQFLLDTVRAAFAVPLERLIGHADVRPWHAFNLLLACGTLLGLRQLASAVGGNATTATSAVVALALSPKFVAHSQSNPKDLIGTFFFVWVLWAAERAVQQGSRRRYVLAGAVLGLALANHVIAATLLPIVAYIGWRGSSSVRRTPLRYAALATAIAMFTAFAAWPWLWPDPIGRARAILTHTADFSTGVRVLFLGHSYRSTETPPHYFLTSLALSTPLLLLIATVAGALLHPADAGHRRLRNLALIAALTLLVAEACAPAHYDGVRHGLPVLPAMALLAGLAFARAWNTGGKGRVAVLAAVAWCLVQLARFHPYEDAYLNEAMQVAWRGRGEECVDLEYWGSSFKEGALWLNANAPTGAVIVMPLAAHCATPYLRGDLDPQLQPGIPGRPHYLMVMTRRGLYPPAVHKLERALQPVHAITRPSGTLLKIFELPISGQE